MDADIIEEPKQYLELAALGREVAAAISTTPVDGLSGSPRYIALEARRWQNSPPLPEQERATGPAADVLELVRRNWNALCAGQTNGEKMLSEDFGIWSRLMRGWPMQPYADQVAAFLTSRGLLDGLVVELGAGVGTASSLIAPHVRGDFVCTDVMPLLMRRPPKGSRAARYNFDDPGDWTDVSIFFAVNALHCARDKRVTLAEFHRMLKPGGMVVLAESAPTTDTGGTPWPLNMFFGLFKGWWDVGGLLTREQWLESFRQTGFREQGYQRRLAGAHDLGGLVWAIK